MGNKPSKRVENRFSLKEREALLLKKKEFLFLPDNENEIEFIENCWRSFQFLYIGSDWNLEILLERIRMPSQVRDYIQNDPRNNHIPTHPLTKQLLKEFWLSIFTDKKLRDFSSSSDLNLLSNADKFILEFEGNLKDPRWKLMYTSVTCGNSWHSFAKALQLSEESLLVVKDKDSCIFGAYKPSPFIPSPHFRDEPNSFVFSVNPLRIYKATGINHNHTYFNYGSKSGFPNGVGFGGQLDYFGLFIDSDFENGHSRANPLSTTFSSPQLSGREEFLIEQVEVWMISERDFESIEYKKSILEVNSEAKALLEMSGREMFSEGLRESVPS